MMDYRIVLIRAWIFQVIITLQLVTIFAKIIFAKLLLTTHKLVKEF
jgi:hypothetical protein